jgi:hypothetical protein
VKCSCDSVDEGVGRRYLEHYYMSLFNDSIQRSIPSPDAVFPQVTSSLSLPSVSISVGPRDSLEPGFRCLKPESVAESIAGFTTESDIFLTL